MLPTQLSEDSLLEDPGLRRLKISASHQSKTSGIMHRKKQMYTVANREWSAVSQHCNESLYMLLILLDAGSRDQKRSIAFKSC
jgi:hypothetical protein